MLDDGLVDELHLFMYPVTLGTGIRLFAEGSSGLALSLTQSETYDNGVLHLAYVPAR